jgi:hypothetical protein
VSPLRPLREGSEKRETARSGIKSEEHFRGEKYVPLCDLCTRVLHKCTSASRRRGRVFFEKREKDREVPACRQDQRVRECSCVISYVCCGDKDLRRAPSNKTTEQRPYSNVDLRTRRNHLVPERPLKTIKRCFTSSRGL